MMRTLDHHAVALAFSSCHPSRSHGSTSPTTRRTEIKALRKYFATIPRAAIPKKKSNRILIATWNIANLGVQHRRDQDYKLLAEIISWFDVVARPGGPQQPRGTATESPPTSRRATGCSTPTRWQRRTTDVRVRQRQAHLVRRGGRGGTVTERLQVDHTSNHRRLVQRFRPLPVPARRSQPATSSSRSSPDTSSSGATRRRPTSSVGAWRPPRSRGGRTVVTATSTRRRRDVLALGDFNLPKVDKSDPIYQALTRKGLTTT